MEKHGNNINVISPKIKFTLRPSLLGRDDGLSLPLLVVPPGDPWSVLCCGGIGLVVEYLEQIIRLSWGCTWVVDAGDWAVNHGLEVVVGEGALLPRIGARLDNVVEEALLVDEDEHRLQ